jgi:hypothetical protein
MCECDSSDAPIVMNTKIVKARKNHKCFECRKIIDVGNLYEFTSGIWPDGPASFHICVTCTKIRKSLECSCIPFGELFEQVTEEGFDFWILYKEKSTI